ncbi:venom carboxylesterase-6-like isoform X1 [Homarus americanus]|uniref:venom carboxylesterase-6-like isoform X1 n=1 Tax=Homarus americanus TaxID=6706 RepID=UPI001C43A549|nr:venom carboxylesterase-6-like isoform X1 [Homarus americanus]
MWTGIVVRVVMVALVTVEVKAATKTRPLEATVRVQLTQGVITGSREEATEGRYFYNFKGIPYAQPPVGSLRFKDPVAAGGWSQPRDGSISPPFCPQPSFAASVQGKKQVLGSEDCLYLNVYTPTPRASGLPVMVWFHGGAFTSGGSGYYPSLPLLTKDIILVVVQYRLGVLGFLSTEDLVLPGNLGLKDQLLALRWVQDNIGKLGGDSNKVTIFGESAGAASAHMHVLSPKAKGLFNRAILQSGSSLSPWALMDNHKQVAAKLGDLLGCSAADSLPSAIDSYQLLSCLQQLPVDKLIFPPIPDPVGWNGWQTVFLPRVDGDILPDHPANLLRSGRYNKVDLISGITQHEGSFYSSSVVFDKEKIDEIEHNFTTAGPVSMYFREWEDDPEYMASRAYYHYLGEEKITEEKAEEFTELLSDNYFRAVHEETAQFHTVWEATTCHTVYKYVLQHRGQHSFTDLRTSYQNTTIHENCVGHADDLQYLFNVLPNIYPPLERPADLFMRQIMVTLWTNFAATGNPTPDGSLGFRWWPTTQSRQWYLALTTSPTMTDDLPDKDLEFWNNMPTKKNKLLYPERFLTNQTCLVSPGW